MSLLATEFYVRSVLHGQLSLAAVNQICAIHESLKGCKNLKIYERIASKKQILPYEYTIRTYSLLPQVNKITGCGFKYIDNLIQVLM